MTMVSACIYFELLNIILMYRNVILIFTDREWSFHVGFEVLF